MVTRILKVINHRDFVLFLAILCGFLLGERTKFLSEISVWVLALVMVFSTISFSFATWKPFRNVLSDISSAVILNYFVFGITLVVATLFIPKSEDYELLKIGIFIIAATPAGPSIIAFTTLMKGNLNYSVNGVFGITILSLGLTPLLLFLLLGKSEISPLLVLPMLTKLIVLPLILSRALRHRVVFPTAKKMQPYVVKWGFFLVIVPTVGLSRDVIFTEPQMVLVTAIILFVAIYGLSLLYYLLMRKKKNPRDIISGILITVIKSSAFSAVVAFAFFEEAIVALPSAVLSIFVTSFYITFSLFANKFLKTD